MFAAFRRWPFRRAPIIVAALFSGGASLAYEVAWSRALVVPLGNASDAAAIVLAAFMIGIGAGAWIGGEWAERTRFPLRIYALMELLLGAYAVVAPPLLSSLSQIPGESGALLRRLLALLLIALPCLAMGMSLPLLVRAWTRKGRTLRWTVGLAYAANTAGAAMGAWITGYWGLALLGVARWSALAALGSFSAAFLATLAESFRPSTPPPDSLSPEILPQTTPTTVQRLAGLATFIMGFVVLANEVLWTRVLTFVFGHDTYAFATMLAVVLVGMALGGALHRLVASADQAAWTAGLLGGFSVASLVSFWLAAHLVIHFGRDPFRLESSPYLAGSVFIEIFRELTFTPLLLFLPCLLAGAAFPAACSLYAHRSESVGRGLGRVTFVNGLGSALGAITTSLLLGTVFSVQGAFFALAILSALMAAVVLFFTRPRCFRTAGWALLPIAAVGLLALWIPSAMPRAMLLATVGPRHQTLLHYEEARTGTVSVVENRINQERQLLMNGINEVTTRLVHDQSFKVLGHLAPLLHPNPKKGVMICLGAGISAGAALAHPLDSLDVVDLSSAVARGARYFEKQNRGVLDDPRFHLHIDDGRQYLLNTSERFDVAMIDSTHPKAVDSWILYTVEFYELVRDRLSEGGIVVQWLPLHGLSEREFKMIVRTFQQAFPSMTLWANVGFETYGQVGYAKLVGIRGRPLAIDPAQIAAKLRDSTIGKDLADWGVESVEELLNLFIAGPASLEAWTRGLPVQHDDRPMIPYRTAFSLGRRMVPARLLAVREPISPWLVKASPDQKQAIVRSAEGQGLVLGGLLSRARELDVSNHSVPLYEHQIATTLPYYEALAALYPDDADRQFEAATQLAALGHPSHAGRYYERALALRPEDYRFRLDYGHWLLGLGRGKEAIEVLSSLRDDVPRAALVHYNLGAAVLASGEAGAAAGHFETALGYDDTLYGARIGLARARIALSEEEKAQRALARSQADNPWDEDVMHLWGILRTRQGRWEEAESLLRKAHRWAPYRSDILLDLGRVQARRGNLRDAEKSYVLLLRYAPQDPAGWLGLADAMAASKRWAEAAESYAKVLELDSVSVAAALGLGESLEKLQRNDSARDAFCLALHLQPGQQRAQAGLKRLEADCSGNASNDDHTPK